MRCHPAAEEALYDSDAMRRFAGLELGDDAIPDETTILNFRHLLERHELTRAIFEAVNAYLRERAGGELGAAIERENVIERRALKGGAAIPAIRASTVGLDCRSRFLSASVKRLTRSTSVRTELWPNLGDAAGQAAR